MDMQHEITDAIYDTLMGNTAHEQINVNDVSAPEVDASRGRISFTYRGMRVEMAIFVPGKV